MSRAVFIARLHLLGLLLCWPAWMLTSAAAIVLLIETATFSSENAFFDYLGVAFPIVLTVIVWLLLNERLPKLARQARLWPVRVVGLATVLAMLAVIAGVAAADPCFDDHWLTPQLGGTLLVALRASTFLTLFVLVQLAPSGELTREPFFLTHRGHASDALARRALLVGAGHALLVALVWPAPERLASFALAYVVGMALALWQSYPQRAIAFVPLGWSLAAIALLAFWFAPAAQWPLLLLGTALGLAHTPPRNELLANLPARQRLAGLLLMLLAQLIGATIGIGLNLALPSESFARFIVALVFAAVAGWALFRSLVELGIESILAIAYPIRGYGPGRRILPTRGPVLVVANHCAWFDPIWLAKVIPLQLRPLMVSTFYDKPVISWLMRRVFRAIRVQDGAFRREAPEIHEAILALERGENVMIFPEGWLKRKDEQSLRRFGQGVYQILRDKPRTPIVACWIEGGWGSYTSYWKGPPTINKRMDWLRPIRIGISEPVVLPLEMLHDPLQTRRYLMQACLRARAHIGLPELPAPPIASPEEEPE